MKTNYKLKAMIFTTAVLFTLSYLTQGLTKNVYATSSFQELLITEVMPMSQTSNDAYEYIEIYNNSNRNIDLKDYKLPSQNMDIITSKILSPKGVLVICTKGSTTLENFNAFYNTALTAEKYTTLPFVDEVLSNDSITSIMISKDDNTPVVRAKYYTTDFKAKSSITYKYSEIGIDMLRLGQNQSPTPGSVSADQVLQSLIKVTGITLNTPLITMGINQSAVLLATVSPVTANDKNVFWTTSNSSIVEVNQKGVLASKAEGVAYITATTVDGGLIAVCTVIVKRVPVTGVTLNKTSSSLEVGKSIKLTVLLTPTTATNKSVNWRSSNSNIATVDSNGTVVGKAVGEAVITVTTVDGNLNGICTINVKNSEKPNTPSSIIRLNKKSIQIKVGHFEKLAPIITPGNLKKIGVTWKSSKPDVAYVTEDGRVYGRKEGTTIITVTTKDGATATCSVQIIYGKDRGKGHSK
jgi:uncharacterized protein YjdB